MAAIESAVIGRIWERLVYYRHSLHGVAIAPLNSTGSGNSMHELSIAQSLLEIIVDESKRHGLERINKVRLQIGKFAAVVPESLTFCFDLVSRDTVASGALIEIETVGISARCEKCDFSFDVNDQVFRCPRCGEAALELLSGRELTVMSIEGETGEGDGGNQSSSCS
ncbi:MAG: hydrogenase maturation nickel metallochaperone HypA [Syntrophobacteraceae bacterium]